MSTTIAIANSSSDMPKPQKLTVGENFKMTVTQDGGTVVDVNTSRNRAPMQQKIGKTMENVSSVGLRNSRYESIMALAALDGNASNITLDDISKAGSLKGKYGIKNVSVQSGGVAVISFNNSTTVIKVDIETKDEKNARVKQEQKAKADAEAKRKAAEKKAQDDYNNRPWYVKAADAVVDFFGGW